MEFAYDLIKIMSTNNYMLAVRHEFQSVLLKPVLHLTERKLNQEPVDSFVKNRVFGAVVECVQNICRPEQTNADRNALLLLSKTDDHFVINTASVVDEPVRDKWISLIGQWQNSHRDELRKELLNLKTGAEELDRITQEKMALLDLFIKSEGRVRHQVHVLNELYLLEIEIKISIL